MHFRFILKIQRSIMLQKPSPYIFYLLRPGFLTISVTTVAHRTF